MTMLVNGTCDGDHSKRHRRDSIKNRKEQSSARKCLDCLLKNNGTCPSFLPFYLLIATGTSFPCNKLVLNSYVQPCRKFSDDPDLAPKILSWPQDSDMVAAS